VFQSFQWFQWLENPTGSAGFGERTGRTLGNVGFIENVKIRLPSKPAACGMRDESLDLRGELRDGVFEIHGAQGTSDGRVYKLLDQPLRSARTRTKHQKENPTIPRVAWLFFSAMEGVCSAQIQVQNRHSDGDRDAMKKNIFSLAGAMLFAFCLFDDVRCRPNVTPPPRRPRKGGPT